MVIVHLHVISNYFVLIELSIQGWDVADRFSATHPSFRDGDFRHDAAPM